MREFNTGLKKGKSYKKFIYSPFTLFLLFLVFLLLLKAVWGVYQKQEMSAKYLQTEQDKLATITARRKELSQSVEYLKTDQGIEAEIRSKFRVVREGESVAVIIDDDTTDTPEVATSTPKTFFQKILGIFGL